MSLHGEEELDLTPFKKRPKGAGRRAGVSKSPWHFSTKGVFPKPRYIKSERRKLWEAALAGDQEAIARLKSWGVTSWVHKGKVVVERPPKPTTPTTTSSTK